MQIISGQCKDDLPKISLITPTFNQAEFIHYTIESVISQEYPNLEYIIIDGGSSDKTIDFITKYKNHIDIFVSEPDDGQTSAINKGLRLATGDIVGWINSDDILLPGALIEIGKKFTDQNVKICSGNDIIIDRDNKVIHFRKFQAIDTVSLLCIGKFSQPTIFWRKELTEKVGYLDESLDLAMDYEYFLRLSRIATFYHLDFYVAGFRHHPNQKTSLKSSAYEVAKISEKYIDELFSNYCRFMLSTYKCRFRDLLWLMKNRQYFQIKKSVKRFFTYRWRKA